MKKFNSCKEAFKSINLQYDPIIYKCYNEEIEPKTELCPFAKNDNCGSKELPGND